MWLEDVAWPLPLWQTSGIGCQLQGNHCLLIFISELAWWTPCIDAAVRTPLAAHGDARRSSIAYHSSGWFDDSANEALLMTS